MCGSQTLVATGLQSVRTGRAATLGVVRAQARKDQTCWQTVKVESGYQQFVKGNGDLSEWRFLRSERFVTLLYEWFPIPCLHQNAFLKQNLIAELNCLSM